LEILVLNLTARPEENHGEAQSVQSVSPLRVQIFTATLTTLTHSLSHIVSSSPLCLFSSSYSVFSRDGIAQSVRATGYGIGVRVPVGSRFRDISAPFKQPVGRNQPPMQCVPEALFPAVRQPGRQAHHSHPPSSEVKNDGAMPPRRRTSSWRSNLTFYSLLSSFCPSSSGRCVLCISAGGSVQVEALLQAGRSRVPDPMR
jgi:hypothetical protein